MMAIERLRAVCEVGLFDAYRDGKHDFIDDLRSVIGAITEYEEAKETSENRQQVSEPDRLAADHDDSRYWLRTADNTFQQLPGEHTNKSWREGPAASSYATTAHLPED